jgi:hypothetical protein
MTQLALSPEGYDVANAYLQYGSSEEAARQTGIPLQIIIQTLQKPDVQNYLQGVYLDAGYRNRNKLAGLVDKIIDAKIEEAEETSMWSKKDLLEILEFAHKMRIDELKLMKKENTTTVNVANFDSNTRYGQLMSKLLGE